MNAYLSAQIQEKYLLIKEAVKEAAIRSGRNADAVRLVVVTKTHPVEVIRAAIDAGIRDFGENYAEEAVGKIQQIGSVEGITWHMIGHVQSRKAEMIARNFHLVHSVDNLKLANRLSRFAGEAGRTIPILLECNVGGEESKDGFPAVHRKDWEALAEAIEHVIILPNLEIRGLMTMPPISDDPEQSRPYYVQMRALQEFLVSRFPAYGWAELSMGTSFDYTVAIEEGATIVRVGTAILGARPPKV